MNDLEQLCKHFDSFFQRLETLLPAPKEFEISSGYIAYRWSVSSVQGIADFEALDDQELLHLDKQKHLMSKNTAQFVAGKPANNALLWGARGTGKSSLIKAQLHDFKDQGLCILEVPKAQSSQLFDIINCLSKDKRKFIIYLDDLSFEANDDSYKALKACLEGSLQPQPKNVLVYATSNRRHLMPENMQDNLDSSMVDGELHPSDAIEEKVSLSDRFGLWLSFYPFTQEQYLSVVEQSLKARGLKMTDETKAQSIRFATSRGSRSGRIAVQFATYWESLT